MKLKRFSGIFAGLAVSMSYAARAYADNKQNVISQINSTGQFFLDIFLQILKWGGVFGVVFLGIAIALSHDETQVRKLKTTLIVIAFACAIGWVADSLVKGALGI